MLKKYGSNKSSLRVFSREYGLNLKIKNLKFLPNKFNSFFSFFSKDKVVGRQLFDYNKSNISFLKSIKSYKGIRHKNRYPVRGQRTHTNATKKNFKFPKI